MYKNFFKRFSAMGLGLLLITNFAQPVMAYTNKNDYTVEKFSNPESGVREADGIVTGGDRYNSYAWAMVERDGYIYIGTNRNLIGSVAQSMVAKMAESGLDTQTSWDIINTITNGEIPQYKAGETGGGQIIKINVATKETEVIYNAPETVSFRMAINLGNDIYFGSYCPNTQFSSDIIKIDNNDNITKVFSSYNGTSFRAATIMDDVLYFGGVDSSETLNEGDENCAKLAVIYKDPEDDTVWHRVADYKDFYEYASDSAVKSSAASPIWDIVAYKGEIYATIPNSKGYAMFKGHKALEGEEANEYGWAWEEIIGNNSEYNLGMSDEKGGFTTTNLCVAATPFVYKDKLYFMDYDNAPGIMLTAASGVISSLAGNSAKPSSYLTPMYNSLKHPQRMFCINDDGTISEVEGIKPLLEEGCTEYLWRTAVYNDKLYITTFDAKTLYNYITKLTNGCFSEMTPQELSDQLNYIKILINDLITKKATSTNTTELMSLTSNLTSVITSYTKFMKTDLSEDSAETFVNSYEEALNTINNVEEDETSTSPTINSSITEITDKIKEILSKIDFEGIKQYAYISNTLRNDDAGFELIVTDDGENFDIVTDDGFGDKYNYGGRTIITSGNSLYIGTANPFYGAQLWKITDNNMKIESKANITYQSHIQSFGWQDWKENSEISGTTGQAKRLEAIKIKPTTDTNLNGRIIYRAHVQTYGWQDWVSDGEIAGTTGQAKRLEAIEIKLTGELAEKYDVYYRAHVQTYGWQDWVKNGETSGTTGEAKRLEAIEIKLVEK